MRGERPSLTATLVAAVRALYAELPEPYRVAPDPAAADLVPLGLSLPARAARAAPWAGGALHRVLGDGLLGLPYHVALRTAAIDDALRAALREGASQVVLLGAGLDNRAQRLAELARATTYEVDHPSTQRYKHERLERSGRAIAAVPVPVDFERDRLDEALPAAGLRAAERSFWIWEGVTVYLTPEATLATLRAVASLSAPGSRIALTYSRDGGGIGEGGVLLPLARALARSIGEPLRGVASPEAMAARLAEAGFEVVSDESTEDWAPRYWPGQRPRLREWERLVIGERRG